MICKARSTLLLRNTLVIVIQPLFAVLCILFVLTQRSAISSYMSATARFGFVIWSEPVLPGLA